MLEADSLHKDHSFNSFTKIHSQMSEGYDLALPYHGLTLLQLAATINSMEEHCVQ